MNQEFLIDLQTKKDIQLHELNARSIWSFFDHAVTEGGEEFLRNMFDHPLLDVDKIRDRQMKISRLEHVAHEDFPFYRVIMKDMEKYVKHAHSGAASSSSMFNFFGTKSPVYYYKKRSIIEICDFLLKSQVFYEKVNSVKQHEDIEEIIKTNKACLAKIFKGKQLYNIDKLKINMFNIDYYDRLIRYELAKEIKDAIYFFYEIDAYFSVARISKTHNFCFPEVYPKNHTGQINMEEAYHVFHRKPVKNNIRMTQEKNMWFLTGANMAGKSSFIKTISTALYLTHIGFPVPARSVKTDLIDGLFTSINLQDNLELGYSHFYVEAIRLKTIIDQLNPDTNALIILDELFKGTNHSDAYNAIFEIFENIAKTKRPYVIVSSHITDLAPKLRSIPSVDFFKMNIESDEQGNPQFTYKIVQGIAEEKLGMWLLRRSGVFDSIERLRDNQ